VRCLEERLAVCALVCLRSSAAPHDAVRATNQLVERTFLGRVTPDARHGRLRQREFIQISDVL